MTKQEIRRFARRRLKMIALRENGKTLAAIGRRFQISKQRVSQILAG